MTQRTGHAERITHGTPVQIAGAGIAGLAAAITLARAGHPVVVHEAQAGVGHRFQGDLQGLENWSQPRDVLDELSALGLTTDFIHHPCKQTTVFDAWGKPYRITSDAPLLYLLERGPAPGSLDSALLRQAQSLGVEVKFNSPVKHSTGDRWILATGPRIPYAIAVGYHCECGMENGFWAICDNSLAPKGYAYLAVLNGQATMKSCLFDDFEHQKAYLQRTVSAFKKRLGVQATDLRPHGGMISAFMPSSAHLMGHPVAGEQAGFQDSLWGFGMRIGITSGVLAARSLLDGSDYDREWQEKIAPLMRTSMVNRAIYNVLGNRGMRRYLGYVQRQADTRSMLLRQYRPSLLKRFLFPLLCKPERGNLDQP